MLLRGVGVFMIAVASSGYGFLMSWNYIQRIRQLEQIYQGFLLLKGMIAYQNDSIDRAIELVGQQLAAPIGTMFCNVAKVFRENNESVYQSWKDAVLSVIKEKTRLCKEEYILLDDFGRILGQDDRETQVKCIENQLENIKIQIGELKSKQTEKCRLYKTMGAMVGMFIMILLI